MATIKDVVLFLIRQGRQDGSNNQASMVIYARRN